LHCIARMQYNAHTPRPPPIPNQKETPEK